MTKLSSKRWLALCLLVQQSQSCPADRHGSLGGCRGSAGRHAQFWASRLVVWALCRIARRRRRSWRGVLSWSLTTSPVTVWRELACRRRVLLSLMVKPSSRMMRGMSFSRRRAVVGSWPEKVRSSALNLVPLFECYKFQSLVAHVRRT